MQRTYAKQIECVEREIAMRRHVYPRRVRDGKMSSQTARYEIETMQAVLATLQQLAVNEPIMGGS